MFRGRQAGVCDEVLKVMESVSDKIGLFVEHRRAEREILRSNRELSDHGGQAGGEQGTGSILVFGVARSARPSGTSAASYNF